MIVAFPGHTHFFFFAVTQQILLLSKINGFSSQSLWLRRLFLFCWKPQRQVLSRRGPYNTAIV